MASAQPLSSGPRPDVTISYKWLSDEFFFVVQLQSMHARATSPFGAAGILLRPLHCAVIA